MSECDGNCEVRGDGHRGEVRPVIVRSHLLGVFHFNYCEEAIAEDERNGMEVEDAQS